MDEVALSLLFCSIQSREHSSQTPIHLAEDPTQFWLGGGARGHTWASSRVTLGVEPGLRRQPIQDWGVWHCAFPIKSGVGVKDQGTWYQEEEQGK